jgi:phage/conjugal plasmid C-4 type zinc finger TraR family protein
MVDFADRASALEEHERTVAIERVSGRIATTKTVPLYCRTCNNPIPAARRHAVPGTLWCCPCAKENEA